MVSSFSGDDLPPAPRGRGRPQKNVLPEDENAEVVKVPGNTSNNVPENEDSSGDSSDDSSSEKSDSDPEDESTELAGEVGGKAVENAEDHGTQAVPKKGLIQRE